MIGGLSLRSTTDTLSPEALLAAHSRFVVGSATTPAVGMKAGLRVKRPWLARLCRPASKLRRGPSAAPGEPTSSGVRCSPAHDGGSLSGQSCSESVNEIAMIEASATEAEPPFGPTAPSRRACRRILARAVLGVVYLELGLLGGSVWSAGLSGVPKLVWASLPPRPYREMLVALHPHAVAVVAARTRLERAVSRASMDNSRLLCRPGLITAMLQ